MRSLKALLTATRCWLRGMALLISFLAAACWIAAGESDVNGDPERDSRPS